MASLKSSDGHRRSRMTGAIPEAAAVGRGAGSLDAANVGIGGQGGVGTGSGTRYSSMHPKMFWRANQKLIMGYPSDSPVSTTDDELEPENLGYPTHSVLADDAIGTESSGGPEDWTGDLGRYGYQMAQQQQQQQQVQHQKLLSAVTTGHGGNRHWAPGEDVIDMHLFLLDDRPWQEFYTLFFTPVYCIAAMVLLLLLLLLMVDGSVLYSRMKFVYILPSSLFAVGLLANLLNSCFFPVPSGSTAPAYDTWSDPLNQQ